MPAVLALDRPCLTRNTVVTLFSLGLGQFNDHAAVGKPRQNGDVIHLVSAPLHGSSNHVDEGPEPGSDPVMTLRDSIASAKQAAGHGDPRRHAFTWVCLDDATDAEIDLVAQTIGCDDLLLEDALSPQQRAKIDIRPNELFCILKMLVWHQETLDVETGQVAVFIGPGYAVTRMTGDGFTTAAARQRLRENSDLIPHGPMCVAWAIADLAVDGYIEVGEAIETEIEQIEEELFGDIPSATAARIYRLNRENIEMRRAVRPLLPIATRLTQATQQGVSDFFQPYFRDVGDNLMRANDMVDAYDTALMTMLMASTARQDLLQNRDMRKIAAWAAIIAVPTAIAGIYGMNFDVMPELHWSFGYPTVLAVMATICFVLYRAFKRSDWI
jgi:magnesium transporter